MFDELIRQLLLKQRELSENILKYPAADHATYMWRVGQHAGIQEVLTLIEDLQKETDPDA